MPPYYYVSCVEDNHNARVIYWWFWEIWVVIRTSLVITLQLYKSWWCWVLFYINELWVLFWY
jgi:hypothetical protein